MISELRMYICDRLLGLIIFIAPKNHKDTEILLRVIILYLKSVHINADGYRIK